VRFGVSAWIYGEAPLEETLARIAAAGYDGVELPGEPDRWPAADVRRLLTRHRLAPVALTASCMFPATPRDLANPDPAIRAQAVRYLVDCTRFAAEVGAPITQMLASGETRLAPLTTAEQEWRWSVEGMREAARVAERLGIRICVEPLNRYEAYLVTSVAEGLRYLDDVGSPAVGLTLDLFHANLEEPDPAASIRTATSRLWHVQVADTNRRGLGLGHLDLAPVAAALSDIGYRGALVVEIMAPGPDPFRAIKDAGSAAILDADLRRSLARLRTHWPSTEKGRTR
jgi:D-psicose/D-tagatose/L-ribulose 3-epimerase